MEGEKLTSKEIQLFNFLHAFRLAAKGGEIKITFHDHEPQGITINDGTLQFDGKGQGLDKMRLLFASLGEGKSLDKSF